jgi:phytoene dehydrogenase-like protein
MSRTASCWPTGWPRWSVARKLRGLDMRGRRDLLELFTKSAGELLDDWFESDPLKAVLGWDSIVGNFASPYTPGTAYVLLHHVWGEVNGKAGAWGHAIGGMGAISEAIAAEARARGVEIRTGARVASACWCVAGGRRAWCWRTVRSSRRGGWWPG